MRLTILGSGTMMPTTNRYPASYLLEHGGERLLLDCGHMTIARLLERGVDLHSISAVAISHFHTDHISHLLPFVHARWVDDTMEKREHRPLQLFGPESLQERWKKWREVSWPEPKESYPLEFTEGVSNARVGGITIQSFPINHVPWFASVGYRISAGGRHLAYTGDLGPQQSDEFGAGIAGVDLLVIEAGAERLPSQTHITAEQAAAVAQRYAVKRVLLTHVREQNVASVQATVAQYPGLELAEDGMVIDV